MKQISQFVSVFHDRFLPASGCWLVGYAALIDAYDLKVVLPEVLCGIGSQHKQYNADGWEIYTPRHKPDDTLAGHLTFALKYEGLDLAILNSLFKQTGAEEIEAWVRSEPVGRYSRRIWFLYEWLLEKQLDCADALTGNFVDVLDPKQQYPGIAEISKRHRVRNNLPGVRDFCPLVRCTETLKKYSNRALGAAMKEKMITVHHDVLARACAFLLLKDSRASFAIEGEFPDQSRAQRWARVIGQAGRYPLSCHELERLQKLLIGDSQFIALGFRHEGGFIGDRDRVTGAPMPDHISARWQDISCLMDGMIATYQKLKNGPINPIILAAMIAFGFVFIHPFVDGNGRIHRYLIHHVIAETGFAPKGMAFPVSAVILEHIDEYKHVLESYSRPRLECIQWRQTEKGNVEVLNQTIDLYRYFDATKQAEFLYDCVTQTVEKVLPDQIKYLEMYDQMKAAINERFDMPDYLVSLLIRFLQQGGGKLSKRVRSKEFKALSQDECQDLEALFTQIFGQAA